MDKRFVCTILAVLAVTVGSAVLAYRSVPPQTAPLQENVSGVERRPVAMPESTVGRSEPEPDYAYIIREHEGRVAVFSVGNESKPEIIYDTLVKFLPDYDRQQMEDGIKVKDYRELVSLIEDYVS